MSETYGSGFGFGSYSSEEPKEVSQTEEMMEELAAEDTHEFTLEVPTPAPAPEPQKPAASPAPIPKYEISQRPLRSKKNR